MSLKSLKDPKNGRRRRLWSLVGYSGDGKSTFAAQMLSPMVVVDADHRFEEVAYLAEGEVLALPHALDNIEINRIATRLSEYMPKNEVGTIVVDSLTEIVVPLAAEATWNNMAGQNKNRAAAFIEKAVTLRWLQSAVTRWGTDVLWIHHLQDGRDNKGKAATRTTVSQVELNRLQRSLNAKLRVVRKGQKRGIYVEWARGKDGMTLWDDTGCWKGMPEKLDKAMYEGLTAADLHNKQLPTRFGGPDEAIAWAVKYGAFENAGAAKKVYQAVKEERNPTTAGEMWEAWLAAVVERRVEKTGAKADY